MDPSHAHREAHTDPFLPKVTDDMLPPLATSSVPTLDDAALAELLADLDAEPPPQLPSQRVRRIDQPATQPEPPPPRQPEPAQPARKQPAPKQPAPKQPAPAQPAPKQPASSPFSPDDEEPEPPETFGPEEDPSVLCQSGDGPVLRSRYGEFRPPVPVGRNAGRNAELFELPTLTGFGLTRRMLTRRGSRVFTLVFVAIFVLIFLQIVVGLVSSAASP